MVVHRRRKKYADLKALPKEKLDELTEALKAGQSPWYLSDVIRTKWKMMTDKSRHAINKMLTRYRDEITNEYEILSRAGGLRTMQRVEKRLQRNLNVLDEYQKLIQIQARRIEMDHDKEQAAKLSFRQNNHNIEVMGKLLAQYGDLGLKVGLLRRINPHEDEDKKKGPEVAMSTLTKMVSRDEEIRSGLLGVLADISQGLMEDDAEDTPGFGGSIDGEWDYVDEFGTDGKGGDSPDTGG